VGANYSKHYTTCTSATFAAAANNNHNTLTFFNFALPHQQRMLVEHELGLVIVFPAGSFGHLSWRMMGFKEKEGTQDRGRRKRSKK
jgi:hypothetical protein